MFHDLDQALQKRTEANRMNLITVYDCIGENLGKFAVPPDAKMAGYTTGSGAVPWTPEQFAANPDAIRIDQAPADTPADETADVYDCENLAGTLQGIPQWTHAAFGSFHAGARPGQRSPLVYMSRSVVTPVVNTLTSAGITSGVGLWLAAPMEQAAAAQLVTEAAGPFPIMGVQFAFLPDHDISVFNAAWFNNVSAKTQIQPPQPGTQAGWRYCGKCTGLFFGPQETSSYCPRGGQHDGSQSHVYELGYLA